MTSSVKRNVDKDDLICPITYQIFRDPVIAGDGHTYERTAIVRWIAEHGTSPLTREPLNLNELQTDDYLKNLAAQQRSSSLSSNYDINLDQSVIQPQNSMVSYNHNIYIDQSVAIQPQPILNNNVALTNSTGNVNGFCSDWCYLTPIIFFIVVILGVWMIIHIMEKSRYSPKFQKDQSLSTTDFYTTRKWQQIGFTIVGGNGSGGGLNQLSSPQGIVVDDDNQCIYIADSENDRIVEWKFGAENGKIIAGGNHRGNRTDQLSYPTDMIVDQNYDSLIICDHGNRRVVQWPRRNGINGQTIISDIACYGLAMDNHENLYVSDYRKNEVRRWKIGDKNGTIVSGGNREGDHLNQLHFPTYIFVDGGHSVYISDTQNARVMKWMKDAKEGIVVAGGQGEGNSLKQLFGPMGVIVDHLGDIYVADSNNHRIICWSIGSKEGSIVVAGLRFEGQWIQFVFPKSLSFDRKNNLYVVDDFNGRVKKFDIISY